MPEPQETPVIPARQPLLRLGKTTKGRTQRKGVSVLVRNPVGDDLPRQFLEVRRRGEIVLDPEEPLLQFLVAGHAPLLLEESAVDALEVRQVRLSDDEATTPEV